MQYLNYKSCHPTCIKKSIPKSLSFRAKKLYSDNPEFEKYIKKLTTSLEKSGYPSKLIKKQIEKPKNQQSKNDRMNEPKFITQFYPGLHKINNIMKTSFHTLQSAPETRNLFLQPPRVIFKRPPL